jgi:hypothetical protein
VRNSGGGELTWMASASVPASLVSVAPGGGTLAGGAQEPVVVKALALMGLITVTIAAADADQSPQTVTITCQV